MKKNITLLFIIVFGQHVLAQYTLNGSAVQESCNSYTLTTETTNQSASVWNNNKINLSVSFDFNFDVNLGRLDATGADGIVFVLQPISTSVGSTGGGLGYEGISPAVGVTIDTWQNTNNNDPSFDHIAIQLNGDLNHSSVNNIAGPVTAVSGNNNIEDSQWHALRVQWDAATKTMTVSVDGILRVSVLKDFVTDIFSGNPLVFWGFTGATGGSVNWQRFRTALNPAFHFSPTQKRCVNEPVIFYDSTISFTTIAKFYWDFGDGSPIDSINLNPVHIYAASGDYIVKQRVIGADGCEATNTQTVRIGSKPVANFNFTGTCLPMPPFPATNFTDSSYVSVGTLNSWYWDFDNGSFSTLQNPSTTYTSFGNKHIRLAAMTIEGCASDTLVKLVHINSQPLANFSFADSVCLGTPVQFFDQSIATGDPVTIWAWVFPDSAGIVHIQHPVHLFTVPGIQTVILLIAADSSLVCQGIKTRTIFIVNKPTPYFKTNGICQSAPVLFTDSSYTSDGTVVNQWWWNLGSGGISIQQHPTVTFNSAGPDTIRLAVRNAKGCISDTLKRAILVNPRPLANFGYSTPLCVALPVNFYDSSGATIGQWSWTYGGLEWSNLKNPNRSFLSGLQKVGLVVHSIAGCKSDTSFKSFFINPSPDVTMVLHNGCKLTLLDFTATDLSGGTVTQWKWDFGDGGIANTRDAQHSYADNGTYKVKLFATAANGCYSGNLEGDIVIYGTNVFAGNDTIAAAGQPVQLRATGGLSYAWTPAQFLDNAFIPNPVALLSATQIFRVRAYTPEGCESFDEVKIKIYKGPDIYLPNAFSPNDDGVNDVFLGIPVGIKQFNYLKIYNRWGAEIFYSTDYRKGWDGKWQGQLQENGVYVVLASGIDFSGNLINKRATVMLVR